MLPDGRVPTHLVQDNVGVPGAAASAAAQVLPVAAEVPAQVRQFLVTADVHAPSPGTVPYSSHFVDSKTLPSTSFARPRIRLLLARWGFGNIKPPSSG